MDKKRNIVGIILEKNMKSINGKYSFVYENNIIESDNNVLHVLTDEPLTDEEIIRRFAGTLGFKEIVRE